MGEERGGGRDMLLFIARPNLEHGGLTWHHLDFRAGGLESQELGEET